MFAKPPWCDGERQTKADQEKHVLADPGDCAISRACRDSKEWSSGLKTNTLTTEPQGPCLWRILPSYSLWAGCPGLFWPGLWGFQGSSQALQETISRDRIYFCAALVRLRNEMLQLLFLCPRTNPSDKPGFAKKNFSGLHAPCGMKWNEPFVKSDCFCTAIVG